MTTGPKRIPWMYNEAYNPYYETGQEYILTSEDITHLEDHQEEYIVSSIPKDLYELDDIEFISRP